MSEDELRRLSDSDLQRLQERLQERVPETTHTETLTYEEAAKKLSVKYERIAALVSQGVLIAEKHPRDAKKYLSSDQIAWYGVVRQGIDDLPNPALVRHEAAFRRIMRSQRPSFDTWAELRRYVEHYMADTSAVSQLNAALTEIAQHVAGSLVRDTLGMEQLNAEERERRAALLAALTQKGGDTS